MFKDTAIVVALVPLEFYAVSSGHLGRNQGHESEHML